MQEATHAHSLIGEAWYKQLCTCAWSIVMHEATHAHSLIGEAWYK